MDFLLSLLEKSGKAEIWLEELDDFRGFFLSAKVLLLPGNFLWHILLSRANFASDESIPSHSRL